MKILTTGGSGLVGSAVIDYLTQQGLEVFDASKSDQFDLLDPADFDSFFTENAPDIIIHFAAFTNVSQAQEEEDDYSGLCYRLNTELTKQIADYAFSHNVHLIYISTDYVFNGDQSQPYNEDDQPEPENWYGKTKYLGEREVIASGVSYTIIRISYPFGYYTEIKSDLVQTIAARLREGTLNPMFRDQIITPTFIPDIARALHAVVIDRDKSHNQLLHVVGNEHLTPLELAQRVQAQMMMFDPIDSSSREEFIRKQGADQARYPHSLAIDNHRFKELYGFEFTPLDQALADVLVI